MADLCSPRRIRSSDRGKGDRLKCGTRRVFVRDCAYIDRLTVSRRQELHVTCVSFNVNTE